MKKLILSTIVIAFTALGCGSDDSNSQLNARAKEDAIIAQRRAKLANSTTPTTEQLLVGKTWICYGRNATRGDFGQSMGTMIFLAGIDSVKNHGTSGAREYILTKDALQTAASNSKYIEYIKVLSDGALMVEWTIKRTTGGSHFADRAIVNNDRRGVHYSFCPVPQ
jgi:hypothetical protein